jgi:DNA-binding transcriptional MerR regulator
MKYSELEQKYLALMSPARLFSDENQVVEFLHGATLEEIKAFIDACVSEESYELAGYANKLIPLAEREWDIEPIVPEDREGALLKVDKSQRAELKTLFEELDVLTDLQIKAVGSLDEIEDRIEETVNKIDEICNPPDAHFMG